MFPGQGSQKPGLLNELPEGKTVQEILETASETLNENVYIHHSKESLCSTKSVQISLLTAGFAGFKALEAEGIIPDFVAGHSVGGVSAAVAAGVIDGVQLAVGVEHGDGRRGVDTDGFARGEVIKAADGNHGPPSRSRTHRSGTSQVRSGPGPSRSRTLR